MGQRFSIVGCDHETVNELQFLFRLFPEYSCISVSNGFDESLNGLLKEIPSLVFIDLSQKGELKDPFCFVNELHHYLEELPVFIGIAKSKRLAYDAIKSNFFDLLLAPLSEFELRKCLMRYQKNLRSKNTERICLKSYSDYRFIDLDEIQYLKADNNTTDFFLAGNRKISAYKTLKHFEESLPGNFLRVHHSYIINIHHVTRINFGRSVIALQDKAPNIPFSKTYKSQVDNLKKTLVTSLSIVS